MDIRKVRSLVDLMRENEDLYEIAIDSEGEKVRLRRHNNSPVVQSTVFPTAGQMPPQNVGTADSASPTASASEEVNLGTAVDSPLVGTFYEASAPGAAPFVKVGQTVKKGDVLCIVEAMKMMNKISAPASGTVSAIEVVNEQPVEFGQVLMYLK